MRPAQVRASQVRVGVVGVGNCASSFVQGLTYYRSASGNSPVPGLTLTDVGGYRISDIALSAAFDVNALKVGRDVAEARRRAYAAVDKLDFPGGFCRRDIGWRELARTRG